MQVRQVACALVAATLVGTAAAPAVAGSSTINDPAGDNATYDSEAADYGDLTEIVVRHSAKALKVTVRGNPGDGVAIYVDTQRKRTGPEFLISWESYLSEALFVSTTKRNWEVARANLKCGGARSAGKAGSVTFVVPRSCLAKKNDKPRRLRVNLETVNFNDSFPRDAAPAFHEFGPWVKKG
jgi:hypothetical protein